MSLWYSWGLKPHWASRSNICCILKISLQRLVELFTTGPARILGIPRGTLATGPAARCDDIFA